MKSRPVAEIIDALLQAPKTLGGVPSWQPLNYDETRLLIPLMIDGVSSGADLQVLAYPNTGHNRVKLKFRLLLTAPKCIWRVDHVHDEPHVNSLDRPADLTDYSFCCPHYHSWADNRHFCTHSSLPNKLLNARPQEHGSFDSTMRWFFSETNIAQPPTGLIDLPVRRTLL